MNQCYFNGEFYQCATATTAGESPATTPGKWRQVQLPAEWRWLLTELTYAHMLELDGQTEKSAAHRQRALNAERIGMLDTVRREAQAEAKRLGRPAVQIVNQC